MPDGVTIDANVIAAFTHDFLAEDETASRTLVEESVKKKGLVVDENGKIQNQWFNTCPGPFFREWYLQNLKIGSIRMVKPKLEQQHRKKLTNDLGFPSMDLIYISVANVTEIRYIVTNDIDFHDPKMKTADQNTKQKLKETRTGPACRYLRDRMEITLGMPAQAIKELFQVAAAPQ